MDTVLLQEHRALARQHRGFYWIAWVVVVAALLLAVSHLRGSATTPVAWEHGWRTRHIIATRYKNPVMGFNIGFTFPLNPNDCDAAALFDFVAHHGGAVYQGGGSPGAEMFATFAGVTNRDEADRKLLGILPAFEDVAAGL